MKKIFKSLFLLFTVFISSSAMAQLSVVDLNEVCNQDFRARRQNLSEKGWEFVKPEPTTSKQDGEIKESYWLSTPDMEINESTPSLIVIYNTKTNDNWFSYSISDELAIAQFEQELTRFEKLEANSKVGGDCYNLNKYILCVNKQKNENPEGAYKVKLNIRLFSVNGFKRMFAE